MLWNTVFSRWSYNNPFPTDTQIYTYVYIYLTLVNNLFQKRRLKSKNDLSQIYLSPNLLVTPSDFTCHS